MDQMMKTDTQANNAPQSGEEARLIIKDRILSDQEHKILNLWNEGKSASEIGALMGVTRNSIIGKIWRMRQKGAETKQHIRLRNTEPRIYKRKKKSSESLGVSFKPPKYKPVQDRDNPFVPNVENIKFWKLKSNSCRYVVNDGRPENFIFCGAPKERGPYCEAHALICYVPPRVR